MTTIMKTTLLFLSLSLSLHLAVTQAPCIVSFPCSCSGADIDCSNKRMTRFTSSKSDSNVTYRLHLNGNPNLVLDDGSFANITLEYLNLDGSVNVSLTNHALRSQRYSLKEIHLSQCMLGFVPEALRDLDALENLYVWSNPIRFWDSSLMLKLSGTLNLLDISDTGLTFWPRWLSHMSNLESLNLYNNYIDVIPHNAFYRFDQTLKYLNIENVGVSDIPTAISSLLSLNVLIVGGSTLGDSSFYINWLPVSGTQLTSLSISNTTITKIPVGIKDSSSLRILAILGSRIKHVDEEAMPEHLSALLIMHGSLDHIHGGICSPSLNYLRLQSNHISSIEKHDLEDCTSLTYLNLNNNDIDYVSPSAFNDTASLETLHLQNNKLMNIPLAVNSLDNLKSLYLDGNPLECTCQTDWFHEWVHRNPNTRLGGRCTLMGIDLANFHSHCHSGLVG